MTTRHDECFLTRDGTYKRLNGAECPFCPAGQIRVGGVCRVDRCDNIPGAQSTVPTGTTRNAAGNCLCNNSGTNPPTCTAPTVDQCDNITGVQATVPAGTTKSGANCNCNNGATNPATCTTCPTGQTMVSGQCTTPPTNLPQCSDGIDNDGDGKIDFGGANADPDCTSATDDTESGDLVCPAGQTRRPTPSSPVCFLTATPRTSPAGTTFSLTGYSHLTGTCTLASATTHDTPPKTISPLVSLGLSVSPSISHITAVTDSSFTLPAQVAGLLTCPHGTATCSIGTGGVISCGCYNTGVTPPTTVIPAEYTCVSNLCAEGQYYCSAENTCKPAGQPCSEITCNYDNKCDVGESCNCRDCTTGVLDNDKDQCGLS